LYSSSSDPNTQDAAGDGLFDYGASISGWWLLWNKLNPFATTVKVPSMGELTSTLMWVSSERHLDAMRRDPRVDLLLRPPVQAYATLEFDKYDEIADKGYRHATEQLSRRMASYLQQQRQLQQERF